MERVSKSLFHKVVSFALAAAMVFSMVVVIKPQAASAAEFSLKAKGGTVLITDEACTYVTGEDAWIKYKASADGYLQLKFSSNSQLASYVAGEARLYDKNKSKYLSETLTYDTSSTSASATTECYGVKKGTTYYIRVASIGGVKINAAFKRVKDKSGVKKSKALNLKKGKNTVGIIQAGSTKSHWFKFNITKNQKLTFNITPYLTGPVSLTVSGPGVKTNTFTINTGFWGKKYPVATQGKLKRTGTYYAQVKPASKICSGYYKVSWK